MPYYLCSNELGIHACGSWIEAKSMTQGRSGSWVKKYSKRSELLEALACTKHVPPSWEPELLVEEASPVAYVDGSCILGDWSACAVFFAAGSEENEVLELSSPHTAPRAELAAVLLCLKKGFRRGRILSDSIFVCRAFSRGWPEDYAHQDIMGRVRELWTPELSIVKVPAHSGQPGNEAVDAMLRRQRLSTRSAASAPSVSRPAARGGSLVTEVPPLLPALKPRASSRLPEAQLDFLWRDL
jgi:ribonuclease HI